MSDSGEAIFPDFGKFIPGFDFLQNLTKQASGAASNGMPKMPNLGSWVAPTLNVEELDRRIQELKSVQFWLDQNATALKATIQALEVQKMTLSALQGMNVNMADMAKAFQMPDASNMSGTSSGISAATDLANTMASNMASTMASMSGGMAGESSNGSQAFGTSAQAEQGGHAGAEKPHHHFAGLEVPETGFRRREQDQKARDPAAEAVKAGAGMSAVIDPMQWWGALTQQFQAIANSALQDVTQRKPFEASQSLAQETLRSATKTASDFAETAGKTLAQSASDARDLMTDALKVSEGWPVPGASSGAPAGGSSGAGKRGGAVSRSVSSSRRAEPARAGAMASGAKAPSSRGKASGKATKTQGDKARSAKSTKTTSGRASKAEGKAEAKGGRSSKARSTPAARKASPRAR